MYENEKEKETEQEKETGKFPAKWVAKFEFAQYVWENWWPDKTKVAEFIAFLNLVFTYN